MAKTFVQLIGLLVILGVVISITTMVSTETMLGLFLFAIPFLGASMMYIALKGKLLQNKELFIVGLASIIVGTTTLLGDNIVYGYSIKSIGVAIAVATELFILFEVILFWKAE